MTSTATPYASHDEPLAYEAAYDRLRRDLLSDAIPPGTRLREVDLAAKLEVSRTPVREALRRLESDGFVQRTAAGGLVATPTGPDDLGDIGLLRIEIDGLAARLAAARGSAADWARVYVLVDALRSAPDEAAMAHVHRDLHREVYAIGFSPRMAAFFNAHLLPYIEDAVNVGPGFHTDPEGSYRQHLALVRALSSGDVERAVQASQAHAASGVRYAKTEYQAAGPVPIEPTTPVPEAP